MDVTGFMYNPTDLPLTTTKKDKGNKHVKARCDRAPIYNVRALFL